MSRYVHLGFSRFHSQASLLKNSKIRLQKFLFLSLFPSHSFRKLKYPFKMSFETTPTVELSWLMRPQVSPGWATPTLCVMCWWTASGRRHLLLQARVIAGTNVTFVLFECCITNILLLPCVFVASRRHFSLSFSTFRSRYLMRMR